LIQDNSLTKAELAAILGVSRARVTQLLNILKLPSPVINFIEKNKSNIEINSILTERKLRPLTIINDIEKCIEKFNEIIGR